MFYFIFAENDLSDSHFGKTFIMATLIDWEHNKKKKDIKLPMSKQSSNAILCSKIF